MLQSLRNIWPSAKEPAFSKNGVGVLFLGDVYGRPGRTCLEKLLEKTVSTFEPDIIAVNGENAAGGLGITPKIAKDFFDLGVNVITTGNHVWKKRDLASFMEQEPRILRPANYPSPAPGKGYVVLDLPNEKKIAIVNLEGRVFMNPLLDPFVMMDDLLKGPLSKVDMICLDFHAEATSEKQALAYYLDGRVSLVVGTHTHVQTADERILPLGTGFISDLGMTGPHDSVIGMEPSAAIARFTSLRPHSMKVAKENPRLQGIFAKIDEKSGHTLAIKRLDLPYSEEK